MSVSACNVLYNSCKFELQVLTLKTEALCVCPNRTRNTWKLQSKHCFLSLLSPLSYTSRESTSRVTCVPEKARCILSSVGNLVPWRDVAELRNTRSIRRSSDCATHIHTLPLFSLRSGIALVHATRTQIKPRKIQTCLSLCAVPQTAVYSHCRGQALICLRCGAKATVLACSFCKSCARIPLEDASIMTGFSR